MSQAQSNFLHLLVVPFISVVTMLVSVCCTMYTFKHTALKAKPSCDMMHWIAASSSSTLVTTFSS